MSLSDRQFEDLKKQLAKKRDALGADEYSKFITRATAAPAPEPQQKSLMEKTASGLDAVFGGGKVGEAIGTGIGYAMAKPEERQFYDTSTPSIRQIAGSALRSASLFIPGGKIAGALGKLGLGAGTSAIASGALQGYAYDAASDIEKEKSFGEVVTPGTGTVIGGAVPAAFVGAQQVSKAIPKLLSYTSDVPEKAFDTLMQRREAVTKAIKEGATPETALKSTQEAVRGLRTTLTKEWQEGSEQLIQEYSGKRIGLGDNAKKMLDKIADDFPVEVPDNLENLSVKESIDLMKQINALYDKRLVRESAEGITVRKFKDFLDDKMITAFGGKDGSLSKFYKNYSSKKQVLDAANDIVKAYSTGKPIQQSTALGRLQALFNENKSAYLDAIIDLEKATGKDLLSTITASKFGSKLPNRLASVSASGGLSAPKGIVDKALDLLILPLSAPRSAAWIARNLGNIKAPSVPTPGDVLANTQAGQKVIGALSESAQNPGIGLSTKAVGVPKGITYTQLTTLRDFVDMVNGGWKPTPQVRAQLLKDVQEIASQHNLKSAMAGDRALATEAGKILDAAEFDKMVSSGNIPQSPTTQKKSNVDGWTGTPSSKPSTVENTSTSKKPSERGDVSVRKTDTSGGFETDATSKLDEAYAKSASRYPNKKYADVKEGQYLYHGTPDSAFRRIREEGLLPNKAIRPDVGYQDHLFFGDTESQAASYASRKAAVGEPKLLRVKVTNTKDFKPDLNVKSPGDFVSSKGFAPENIEVKIDGKWMPIRDYYDMSKNILPLDKKVLQAELDYESGKITQAEYQALINPSPTSGLEAEARKGGLAGKTLYHATPVENAGKIATDGLKPSSKGAMGSAYYFTTEKSASADYVKSMKGASSAFVEARLSPTAKIYDYDPTKPLLDMDELGQAIKRLDSKPEMRSILLEAGYDGVRMGKSIAVYNKDALIFSN